MKYVLWYYGLNKDGKFVPRYDLYTGTRYECYKIRKSKDFQHQYKVHILKW